MEKNGLGPAATGTQHVTVGETTTGGQSTEVCQIHGTGQQVTHVYIHRIKTGTVEGCSGFHVAVDPLFTQDHHLRALLQVQVGCRKVFFQIKAEFRADAGVTGIQQVVKFFQSTVSVVAQCLDAVAGFCPAALVFHTAGLQQQITIQREAEQVITCRTTNHLSTITQTGGSQLHQHIFGILLTNLHHSAQFFTEQCSQSF